MSERLTARDIEAQRFERKVRGYDPSQVRLFLSSVAEEVERLNLENGRLREDVDRMRQELEAFRHRERSLQETLVAAQKMSDELKQRSQEESDLIVREARMKAERLLQQAQDQLARIESEISRAKLERDLFENRLRSAVEEHLSLLELRQKERAEVDNLRFLRRRSGSEAG